MKMTVGTEEFVFLCSAFNPPKEVSLCTEMEENMKEREIEELGEKLCVFLGREEKEKERGGQTRA